MIMTPEQRAFLACRDMDDEVGDWVELPSDSLMEAIADQIRDAVKWERRRCVLLAVRRGHPRLALEIMRRR